MPAVTVTLATPAITRANGNFQVNFSDGTQLEFSTAEGVQQWCRARVPAVEGVKAQLITNRLAVNPLLNDPAQWDGKQLTFDVENVNPVLVYRLS